MCRETTEFDSIWRSAVNESGFGRDVLYKHEDTKAPFVRVKGLGLQVEL